MAIPFKQEQLDVINTLGKNIIVSASAGSGKTTVMIEKIIRLVRDHGLQIKNLLVLTYTTNSAQEMKQKLLQSLTKAAQQSPKLLAQIDDVSVADISTIHSFLQGVLKKYFSFVDLNPSFTILDANMVLTAQKQAFKNAFEKFENSDPENHKILLETYGNSRNNDKILSIVKKINSFLVSFDDAEKWCGEVATKLYQTDIENNIAISWIMQNTKDFCDFYLPTLEEILQEATVINAEKCVKYLTDHKLQLSALKFENKDYFYNSRILKAFKKGIIRFGGNFADLTEKCKSLKRYLDGFLDSYIHLNEENFQKSIEKTKIIVEKLITLTLSFQNEYSKIKLEKNALDFDDLEKYMLKLLQNKNVCEEIKSKYDLIFIDEYQDANRVQEKILSLISKPTNRFMVGDMKQSIYAFRQAEPEIFHSIQEKYQTDPNSCSMKLNFNFRSNKAILNFVNVVFSKIMTLKTAQVDYKNKSKMVGDVDYKLPPNCDIPVVEIDIIRELKADNDKKEPISFKEVYSVLNDNKLDKEAKKVEREAAVVAQKINSLLGKQIYIASEDKFREITFKDITVLMVKRSSYLDQFCKVLQSFKIPIYANTKDPLYKDTYVATLICLLKLCRNFRDDTSLAVALHSPFGGLSYEELSEIRLKNPDCKNFYECVENSKDDPKIQAFYNLISELKFGIDFDGVYYTLYKIINRFNLKSKLQNTIDGQSSISKIDKFMEDFLTNGFNNDYISFLNFAEENYDEVKSPNFVTGENCVNITTMHSSKGLEYPIVFIVGTGDSFYGHDKEKEININKKFGIGVRFNDLESRVQTTTSAYEVIKQASKLDEFADKLRLLYVALTRPQNHLFIVGTLGAEEILNQIKSDYQIIVENKYLPLILQSLPPQEIFKINSNQSFANKDYAVNIILANTVKIVDEDKASVDGGKVDNNVKQMFEKYFNYKYPHQTQITLKNSVTSLLKANEDEFTSHNPTPQTFDFKEHQPAYSPEEGILYHSILEKIDFEKAKNFEYVQDFINQNYSQNQVDSQIIYNCAQVINQFNIKNHLKEQQFMMQIPHKKIVENGSEENILVQGVIDLLLLGEKTILIDYKLTNTTSTFILEKRYKNQMRIYKIAAEKAIKKPVDEVYLLLIKQQKLVKINV